MTNAWTSSSPTIKEGDFLSLQLRSVLDSLKTDPSTLDIPSYVSLAFLSAEKIDFDKIKSVRIDSPQVDYDAGSGANNDQDILHFDFSALAQAQHLETITLKFDTATELLDASALASIPFKHLIIETHSDLLEHVKGLPGKTVEIKHLVEN